MLKIGVHVLPHFPKDTTDRNRTSPFAFTGNKFEFRMLGSAASISDAERRFEHRCRRSPCGSTLTNSREQKISRPLCTISSAIPSVRTSVSSSTATAMTQAGWRRLRSRGLLNLKTTPACAPYLMKEKNVRLFVTHKVYSETELHARYEILLENYSKVLRIEALTMLDMVQTDILPDVSDYTAKLVRTAQRRRACSETRRAAMNAGRPHGCRH